MKSKKSKTPAKRPTRKYNYNRSPNFNLSTYLSNIKGGFISLIIIISIISISIIIIISIISIISIIIIIISIIPLHHFESKFVQATTRCPSRLPNLSSPTASLST